jgi:hypothetical protein
MRGTSTIYVTVDDSADPSCLDASYRVATSA